MTNISLSEYIRKRRLTNAGYDFTVSKEKIIDIAIKYQYNNATSFSRAFESFHGVKPSKVSKEIQLKNFPRIVFDEKVKINKSINYQVIELNDLKLYGLGIKTNNERIKEDAPKLFKKLSDYNTKKYGMTKYKDNIRGEIEKFYVLFDEYKEGFEEIIMPASKYLILRIDSRSPKDIQKTIKQFYLEFLPSCKFALKELPELEYYHDEVTDFLVPIY